MYPLMTDSKDAVILVAWETKLNDSMFERQWHRIGEVVVECYLLP